MHILVTGGLGYIGSIVSYSLSKDHKISIIDNLINKSNIENYHKFKKLNLLNVNIYLKNINDINFLNTLFKKNKIDVVIHLASLKSTPESNYMGGLYYYNNVFSSEQLFKCMKMNGINKIIFSSSAAVYGDTSRIPTSENDPLNPKSNYAKNKLAIEKMLINGYDFKSYILRYFNPAGCSEDLIFAQNIKYNNDLFTNLIKSIKSNSTFHIFGNDYKTRDGTCIRDYFDVNHIALWHKKLLGNIEKLEKYEIYNIGSNSGQTINEILLMFQKNLKSKIKYDFEKKRESDVAESVASTKKISSDFNWNTKNDLNMVCKSLIKYFNLNNS